MDAAASADVALAGGPDLAPEDLLDAVALHAAADSLADRLAAASEAARPIAAERSAAVEAGFMAVADSTVAVAATAADTGNWSEISN